MIHIAGLRLDTNTHVRQRCAWCGAVLVDVERSRTAFEITDPRAGSIPAWAVGGIVFHDGGVSYVIAGEFDEGDGCFAGQGTIWQAEPGGRVLRSR